jgi:hypothetical protein
MSNSSFAIYLIDANMMLWPDQDVNCQIRMSIENWDAHIKHHTHYFSHLLDSLCKLGFLS